MASPAHAIVCFVDADGDGFGDAGDAGTVDPDGVCDAGFSDNSLDCDDTDQGVHPGAAEICDDKDNDCNGTTDDGLQFATWYFDADGDGFGSRFRTLVACLQPGGYVADSTDCDDFKVSVHPGAVEVWDHIDNNCDGQVDEGFPECPILNTGDANLTGTLTSADIIYLVNFIFKSGPTPQPCQATGDVNCDGGVTAADIIFLVRWVFHRGPPPCDVCLLIPSAWGCP